MAKYLTVALLGVWLAFSFTVGVSELTGENFAKIGAAIHKDGPVKAPTFDLLPLADFQSSSF
jgi:hypothetical protein